MALTSDDLQQIGDVVSKSLQQSEKRVAKRFDQLDGRLERVEGKIDKADERIDALHTYIEGQFDEHYMTKYEVYQYIEDKLEEAIDDATEDLQRRVQLLEAVVKKVNLVPAQLAG